MEEQGRKVATTEPVTRQPESLMVTPQYIQQTKQPIVLLHAEVSTVPGMSEGINTCNQDTDRCQVPLCKSWRILSR